MTAPALDERLLRLSLEIDGKLQTYDGLAISACGTKYANANQNECEVKITNLAKATRDYIITQTSPFKANRTRKKLILEAGRKSYGYSTLYVGDICAAVASQPPDITLTLKCATGEFSKGSVIARSQPGQCSLSTIASQVAKDLGLSLRFECTDKRIANYAFTGGALRQVDQLCACGGVNAYVDDGALILKNYGAPLAGSTRILSADTGMIGTPEFTERGIKVKMLYDNTTKLGTGLVVSSVINPAANGQYTVYKLSFEVANRDTPFYLIAEGQRVDAPVPGKQSKPPKVLKVKTK